MNLVLGLGNPGKRYEKTPHNVGLYLVDSLAASSLWKKSGNSAIQKVFIKKNPAILAKPSTYMNLSGEAARFLLSYYRISSSELIAVVDDANLNLGAIRIRLKGSHGGHNGLKSIIQYCGEDFTRIRIGVGKCPEEWDLTDFVLKKFNTNEFKVIKDIEYFFHELIACGLQFGWEKAASKYNRSSSVEPAV